jgi:hypothetical protein
MMTTTVTVTMSEKRGFPIAFTVTSVTVLASCKFSDDAAIYDLTCLHILVYSSS